MIFCAEFFGFGPGCGFDLEKLDVLIVVGFVNKSVAKFMKQGKIIVGINFVINRGGRMKKIAVAGHEGEIGIILAQAREEIILRVFLALWHNSSIRK